jgi:hypothetical protein
MIRRAVLGTPLHSAWVGTKIDLEWDRLGLVPGTVTDFIAEIDM